MWCGEMCATATTTTTTGIYACCLNWWYSGTEEEYFPSFSTYDAVGSTWFCTVNCFHVYAHGFITGEIEALRSLYLSFSFSTYLIHFFLPSQGPRTAHRLCQLRYNPERIFFLMKFTRFAYMRYHYRRDREWYAHIQFVLWFSWLQIASVLPYM